MAKTAKVKKRAVSIRSRAARRDTSPGIDLDRSITSIKAPVETTKAGSTSKLRGVHNAGIGKKDKAKAMSRQKRLRHVKGLEKADAHLAKLEKKVATSKTRSRSVKARAAAWEELNERIQDVALRKNMDGKGTKKAGSSAAEATADAMGDSESADDFYPLPPITIVDALAVQSTERVEATDAPVDAAVESELAPDMRDDMI